MAGQDLQQQQQLPPSDTDNSLTSVVGVAATAGLITVAGGLAYRYNMAANSTSPITHTDLTFDNQSIAIDGKVGHSIDF